MALPGASGLLRASITDIAARRRAERITAGERNVFERIAADAPLTEVLDSIVDLIESINAQFHRRHRPLGLPKGRASSRSSAAACPRAGARLEQRMPIDIRNGSSAAAVYLGRHVLVADIESDAFWQRRRDLAREAGFRPPGPYRSRPPTVACSAR